MDKSELILIISESSNKYGNKLVEFMETYNLQNLEVASIEQLKEFIKTRLREEK